MQLLNQKEVLRILDISWKKLREYEHQGILRVARISLGTVRYVKEDVLQLKDKLSKGGE